MKIAIIGAGAAGMTTAHLLSKKHELTVFEKQNVLGGNIRTLNKNIKNTQLNKDLIIDCGVLEFQAEHFTNFHKLMKSLGIKLSPAKTSSELFLTDGHYYKSGAGILFHCQSLKERYQEFKKVIPLCKDYFYFLLKTALIKDDQLFNRPLSDFLKTSVHDTWLKMLMVYAYSSPLQTIENFPAEIAIPLLKHSNIFTKWDRIPGGVYSYIEKILEQFNGKIRYQANIKSVSRSATGVELKMADGENLFFDKVIFAVTPDLVLDLLIDSTEEEKRRFSSWRGNHMQTIVHSDISFYRHFGVTYFSEFDLFQNENSSSSGYNAYLNRWYNIDPAKYQHLSLAYNLGKRINPSAIIHKEHHHTPLYSVNAVRYRNEIKITNGSRHTYHVGAYLGDGLHEGAISSAFAVAALLN